MGGGREQRRRSRARIKDGDKIIAFIKDTRCRCMTCRRARPLGPYGGTFVAETLIGALVELKDAYEGTVATRLSRPSLPMNSTLCRPPESIYHASVFR